MNDSHATIRKCTFAVATGLLLAMPVAASALPIDRNIAGLGAGSRISATPVADTFRFEVMTDSVVATVRVRFAGNPSPVTVRWGDNSTSTNDPGLSSTMIGAPPSNPKEPRLQHVYNAPADGAAFNEVVTVQVGNASDSRFIAVTPRFRVNQYQASFTPIDHCDSFAERESEWRIGQTITSPTNTGTATVPNGSWYQERLTNAGIDPTRPGVIWSEELRVLPGSQASRDATMNDPHSYSNFTVTELDPLFDDHAGTRSIDLHPSLGTRHIDLLFNDDSGCKARVVADVNVELLKPGLVGNQPVLSQG